MIISFCPNSLSIFRSVYMGLVTTFGVTCSLISMAKSFALPKYRTYRAVLFMIFGGVGLFPLIHFTYVVELYFLYKILSYYDIIYINKSSVRLSLCENRIEKL